MGIAQDVNVRSFEAQDVPAVLELWKACGLTRDWNDPNLDIERKLQVQPELFLVAVSAAKVVGSVMAGYEGHRGWINYLAVTPGSRRSGIGLRLMREAEERLASLGCPKVNLQVRGENSEARGFYRAIGYSVDDVVSFGKRLEDDS